MINMKNTVRPSPPFHIFCIEDNPSHIERFREALNAVTVPHHVNAFSNGMEALAFLRRSGACADLILLDVNLRGMDGWAVLALLKHDHQLRHIPVVVVTASQAERDLLQAYQLHANCYIAKPVESHEFLTAIQEMAQFWLVRADLPPRQDYRECA